MLPGILPPRLCPPRAPSSSQVQDTSLSRTRHGFESHRGHSYQDVKAVRPARGLGAGDFSRAFGAGSPHRRWPGAPGRKAPASLSPWQVQKALAVDQGRIRPIRIEGMAERCTALSDSFVGSVGHLTGSRGSSDFPLCAVSLQADRWTRFSRVPPRPAPCRVGSPVSAGA